MERSYLSLIMLVMVTLSPVPVSAATGGVDVVQGKVQTDMAKKKLTIFLLDRDGSILDITVPDAKGNFKLDATIMDDPFYDNLIKLKIRISEKKGAIKDVEIADNVFEYVGRKVTLDPQTFP